MLLNMLTDTQADQAVLLCAVAQLYFVHPVLTTLTVVL